MILEDNAYLNQEFDRKPNKTDVKRPTQVNMKNCLKRTCIKCGKEDWITNFYKNQNICKDCYKKQSEEYRHKTKTKEKR